jgi:hypothetical protein
MDLRASSSDPASFASKPSRRASAATLDRKSSSSSTINASSLGCCSGSNPHCSDSFASMTRLDSVES